MPVPTLITDLSTTASENSPAGSEAIFPNLDDHLRAAYAFIAQNYEARTPAGVIVLWSGAADAIPSGWALCDGTNGTPDLRNRFVVGAGDDYAVGDTGGAETNTLSTANLPSHTHSFSATSSAAGSHSHTVTTTPTTAGGALRAAYAPNASVGNTGTMDTNSVANHTHTVSGTTGGTGSGTAVENRPPYYALCYIQKT